MDFMLLWFILFIAITEYIKMSELIPSFSVKLTGEGIKWMVKRESSENFTVRQASRTYGITERRVQQLTKMYRDTDGDLSLSKLFLKWYNNRIHGALDYINAVFTIYKRKSICGGCKIAILFRKINCSLQNARAEKAA